MLTPGEVIAAAFDPVIIFRAIEEREPHPAQLRLLRSRKKRRVAACARQTGKTSVMVALAVHCAVYQPGSTILVAAPTARQSLAVVKRCRKAMAIFPHVTATNQSVLTLQLSNGSEILSAPATPENIRGLTVDLALCDESGFCADELFTDAVIPMLAMAGRQDYRGVRRAARW
jgi:hypothetical protein